MGAATYSTAATRGADGPATSTARSRWRADSWRIARPFVSGAGAVFVVVTALFFVSRVMSDPARRMLDVGAPEERRLELTAAFGLDRPLWVQYREFLGHLVRLDFADSLWQGRPSLDIVLEQLPSSLGLVALSTLVSVVVFVPLGMVAALHAGRPLDSLISTASLGGVSLPQFWLGQMLILVFAVRLGWLPTFGTGSVKHLVLPVATMAIVGGGRLVQLTRSVMLEQLNASYVRTARAKGFSTAYVLRRHVARNIAVPIITLAAWDLADGLAGNVILVEAVFGRSGLGATLLDAIERQDVVLIEACVFVIAVIVVVTNAIADALYRRADPRTREVS